MRKKTVRAPRESVLASGWTVEGEVDPAAAVAPTQPEAAPIRTPETGVDVDPSLPAAPDAGTADAAVADAAELGRPQMSNGALVSLGVFGGLYLLYTVGWVIVAQAYSAVNAITAAGSGSIGGVLQQIVFWAAPFAPALWFFMALALSRRDRAGRLAILLAIGAVVLLPLPMLIARGG